MGEGVGNSTRDSRYKVCDTRKNTHVDPTGSTCRHQRHRVSSHLVLSSAKGSVRFDCLGGGGGPGTRVVAFANDDVEDDDEKPIARQV
uniref:Uncharacterized protein n=1 Tax=Oryza brachyantha TaxID=4533 RepID=J3MCG6_ORYBR